MSFRLRVSHAINLMYEDQGNWSNQSLGKKAHRCEWPRLITLGLIGTSMFS